MSNLCLDEPNTLETVEKVFESYEQFNNIWTFILCGEFISQEKVDSIDFEEIKFFFDELAKICKKYPRIKNEWKIIMIPGQNDPCSDQVLPNPPLLEYFRNQFPPNTIFASNPCRISFFGKQIIVSRYNYLKKIKKNSLFLGGDKGTDYDDNKRIAKTILLQANLMPLFYLVQPIYWDYAEVLNINNSPDFLILADTWGQYHINDLEDIDTRIVNPGNFSSSRSFTVVYPNREESEECIFEKEASF